MKMEESSKRSEGLKSGTFGDSKEDPLLRAEREKRLKERSEQLEEQYK